MIIGKQVHAFSINALLQVYIIIISSSVIVSKRPIVIPIIIIIIVIISINSNMFLIRDSIVVGRRGRAVLKRFLKIQLSVTLAHTQ